MPTFPVAIANGRDTATSRSPSAVAQSGSGCGFPSSGTGAPVHGVRSPVASCSSSRGVTVSGVVPVAFPASESAAPAGTGTPAARAGGARTAPTAFQVRPSFSRPRSSASARVVSTAISRGGSPAPPSHCPTATPRSVAGLTSPPVAAPTTRPCPAAGGAVRVSARSVPTDRSAWSCWERCQVASNPIPYVAAAQPSPISSPAATACGLRAASNAASGSINPRARTASRSTMRNAGHTRRNVTADPAMSSSAGASTRTASMGEPEPVG